MKEIKGMPNQSEKKNGCHFWKFNTYGNKKIITKLYL